MQSRAIISATKCFFPILIFCAPNYTPEQVHLSLSDNVNEMHVMWVRHPFTSNCSLSYGNKNNLNQDAAVNIITFRSGIRTIHTHQATMQNLKADTKYYYRITCEQNSTKIFDFKTLPIDPKKVPTTLIVSDLGLNAISLKQIESDAKESRADVILHGGDIAYDMWFAGGLFGDKYMRRMEATASTVPYMVAPGNHEYAWNVLDHGSNYENRFKMPGNTRNQYYSFQVGKIMYIILNSEVYYYSKFKDSDIVKQEKWFNGTMSDLNKKRHLTPWVIVIIHRPLYSSGYLNEKLPKPLDNLSYNTGVDEKLHKALDDLFYNTGVDLVIYGHNHHYERIHPVHNMQVKIEDRSNKDIIRNPKASLHIVNGAGGNREGLRNFDENNIPEWSAVRIKENGFLRVRGFNYTHLYAEFFSTTKNEIKDQFWIFQEKHGPFNTLEVSNLD